ncbi:kelch repeat protein [Teladorsagia circumcincta]|uniref:Kelch repeat protein n=1 Tax=Teladorsagia circumcincta TaxID=45464 RepID=A0A2G9U6W0_TELCI|nr:kelch repeat protein [Teladorsagia circumcincta]
MEGRYRLEAVLHDDLIFLFGGGRPDYVTELRTITVFDTKKKVFVDLPTLPDESIGSANWEDGYPKGRRWEGCLLVWGGVRDIYSSHRTNIGQYCYLEPPSLKTLAALSLRPYISYKTVEEANNLRFSCVMEVVRGICSDQSLKCPSPAISEASTD